MTVAVLLALAMVVSYFGDSTGQAVYSSRTDRDPFIPHQELYRASSATSGDGSGAGVNPYYRGSGQIPQGLVGLEQEHNDYAGPYYTQLYPLGWKHGNHGKENIWTTFYWPPGFVHGNHPNEPHNSEYHDPTLVHNAHKRAPSFTSYHPPEWIHNERTEGRFLTEYHHPEWIHNNYLESVGYTGYWPLSP